MTASFLLSFGLLCFVPSPGFGQNAISTGTHAGFRMYYPSSNDWWLDPSQGRFDIRVNGNPAPLATLNSLGNLGIGTTNPQARLNLINGNIQISTNTGTSYGIIFQDGSMQTTAATGGTLWSASGSNSYLTNTSGNVGIGTTNPGGLFQVGRGSFTVLSNGSVGIGTTAPSDLVDVMGRIGTISDGVTQGGGLDAWIVRGDNGATYVDPTNASQEAPVLVNTSNALSGQSSANNTWTGYDFGSVYATSGFIGARIAAQFPTLGSNGTNTNLLFLSRTNSALTEKMRIASSGYVGIGTTNPAGNLDVEGSGGVVLNSGSVGIGTTSPNLIDGVGNNGTIVNVVNASGGIARFAAEGGNGAVLNLVHDAAPANQRWLQIVTQGGLTTFAPTNDASNFVANSIVIQHSSGNVGIGTTSPGAQLDVENSANATFIVGGSTFVINQGFVAVGQNSVSPRSFYGQVMDISANATYLNDNSGGQLRIGGTNTTQTLMLGYDTTNDNAWIQAVHTNNSTRPLALNPGSGYVGIGTTNPQAELDVNGDIALSGASIQGYFVATLCAARGTLPYGGGGEAQSYTVAGPSVAGNSGGAKCSTIGKSCYLAVGGINSGGASAYTCNYGFGAPGFYACCQ